MKASSTIRGTDEAPTLTNLGRSYESTISWASYRWADKALSTTDDLPD
jgi:hypothetical protein